uniref:DUF4878 domain-containing protein n=1 Tax=Thermosporothrix sp. COM3 TaxID=2490863 RepID=A0A455SLT5_9CHLR|nr:hypothetical protein KTC_41640 [Thermosporothrix sp. COM3]
MQTPHHSSEEEPTSGSQPFFEYSREELEPPAEDVKAEEQQPAPAEQKPSEGEKGTFVYPPPPDFYQNMPERKEAPPEPAARPAEPMPEIQSYHVTPAPPPVMAAPRGRKRPHTWTWISLGAFVVLIVLSCSLCSILTPTMSSAFSKSVANTIVNQYYMAIQNKEYEKAYSLLSLRDGGSLTKEQFETMAKERDQQYGEVRSFSPKPGQATGDTNLMEIPILYEVTRDRQTYTVKLDVRNVNGEYKIVGFDVI